MKLNNKKVLITGANGFIGANLARYLVSAGIRPYLILRKESNTWRIKDLLSRTFLTYADLRDKKMLKQVIKEIKPQIIFHTAACGGYPSQQDADEIMETNFSGTINLVNSCQNEGFELLVNTGSSSEYGIKSVPMREDNFLEPITNYAVSKAAAALFCHMKAAREHLPIVTLRIFSPYGYYEERSRLIPSLILSCLRGKNPRLSSPESVRDFVFIEDVIEAYVQVVEHAKECIGNIFNIGAGRQFTVGEVVREIITITGDAVTPLWGRSSNPRVEPAQWCADISKAERVLGWQPRHELRGGLHKNIQWFKNNLFLYEERAA